ncbi:sodium-coupled monocarboxylate transporter 2-like [Periplaneta americana]|uniref:sodium-coupled monocarboxylate transporter 2-like n=1 Tax=Periplaneta americana TaxID=6978 RepID=UPI0037E82011
MNSTSVQTDGLQRLYLGWADYTVFSLMLSLSTLIGIYFGFWGRRENTPLEYLHGGRKLNVTPVIASMTVSYISGITVLGAPSEIYLFGTLSWLYVGGMMLMGVVNYYFILPVFYELKVVSIYEYLELRFNHHVRRAVSFLSTIDQILRVSMAVYVTSLALSQVIGVGVEVTSPAVSVICIIYTMLGGIRAVVWTDLLQGIMMLMSSLAVIIIGIQQVGGLDTVWRRSEAGGRIRFFEFSASPYVRLTFWNAIFCQLFFEIGSVSLNQSIVQRYVSLPTFRKARMSAIISCLGVVILWSLACFSGLVIYSKYYECDPLKAKVIQRPDQIFPYYVMDVCASIPGLSGLFVAGVFSATLSTMSSSLNSMGATVYEDFVKPCLRSNVTDKMANNIIKLIVALSGLLCICVAFLVAELGNVIQMLYAFGGITLGAIVGVFTFGMFYHRGNSKGALAGSVCSFLIMSWIVIGAEKAIADGKIELPVLPTRVDGCQSNVTLPNSIPRIDSTKEEEVLFLYRISYQYYTLIGMAIMFTVAIIVSFLTGGQEEANTNPVFFTPIVRKYIEDKRRKSYSMQSALRSLLQQDLARRHKGNAILTDSLAFEST